MVAERERVFIIGVGCTAFTKVQAISASITYDAIEAAFVGYVFGASTCGQAALYQLGLTGIPITNVNNNCATGSTALFNAATLVRGGEARCALALGFERMAAGALSAGKNDSWQDRPSPIGPLMHAAARASPDADPGRCPCRHFRTYGGGVECLAKIESQARANNPYAQFRAGYSEAEVLASPQITNELTKFMCSPTSDGAACCIVANESFVRAHKLENQAIEMVAIGLATDGPDAFAGRSAMDSVGYGMTRRLADKVFASAGANRDDVGVVELHDCFAANELITYSALGLCAIEDTCNFVERGDNTYGGKYVINPSGGLEAKGHPLGAGPMQTPGLFNGRDARGKYGLVHNIGLGGAVVISLLRRPEFYVQVPRRLGYNHAYELRPSTRADVDKVMSRAYSESLLHPAKL
ncbi:thiolase-like protein [Russula aff. rugulosa BPL654]|nr:thiolase-like protein [Russula aff. rugulosa BPL654]